MSMPILDDEHHSETPNLDQYMETMERENSPCEIVITTEHLTYIAQVQDSNTKAALVSAVGSTVHSALLALDRIIETS